MICASDIRRSSCSVNIQETSKALQRPALPITFTKGASSNEQHKSNTGGHAELHTQQLTIPANTGTLSRLPSVSGIFLVVQNKQSFFYEPTAEQFGVAMLVLPKGIERITSTRLWIAEHAAKTGYAKHVQIDKDLYFRVQQEGDVKTVVATKDNAMVEFAESSPTEVWLSTENSASSKAVV